jgi:hypothetical protein
MRFSLSFVSALLGTVLLAPSESSACGGCCMRMGCMPMSMNHHNGMAMGNHSGMRMKSNGGMRMNNHSAMKNGAMPTPGKLRGEEAKIKAALAKLSPEDQRLAEAQGYCPIMQDNRLGSMGTPVKVLIKGQPVFLCCPGCREEALAYPDATLAKVAKLKARAKAAAPQ